ncbi:MAG: hypothetical protein KatS3mg105_1265 [Gemmatales bacterium]|nr:MAG: hypothetical protein KatS3mg105_1265 [Gemmatales bacterium]
MINESNTNRHVAQTDHSTETVSPEELRKRFREFVNDEPRFRKFIEICNKTAREHGRLTFWQQELWESFTGSNPEFAHLGFSAIVDAFYVCHVHMTPLRRTEVPIRKGLWCETHTSEVESQIVSDAPYSTTYALDSDAWINATHITVDHCDECLAKRRQICA